MSDNTEIAFRYDSNYKYFFDPNKDDITAHDIAQILPILIEAWTNKTLPSLVRQKKIFSDLNDQIDNLPTKTNKNCFKEFANPDSQSVIQGEIS